MWTLTLTLTRIGQVELRFDVDSRGCVGVTSAGSMPPIPTTKAVKPPEATAYTTHTHIQPTCFERDTA